MSKTPSLKLRNDPISPFAETSVDCYKKTAKISSIVSKYVTILFGSNIFLSFFGIPQTAYRVFIRKENLTDAYIYPIAFKVPYEVNTWSRYLLTYIWMDFGFSVFILMKMISSLVQFILCFYAIAAIRNVQLETKEFNDNE